MLLILLKCTNRRQYVVKCVNLSNMSETHEGSQWTCLGSQLTYDVNSCLVRFFYYLVSFPCIWLERTPGSYPLMGAYYILYDLGGFLKYVFLKIDDYFNNLVWDSIVWDIGRSILGIMAVSIRWEYPEWLGRIPEIQIFS